VTEKRKFLTNFAYGISNEPGGSESLAAYYSYVKTILAHSLSVPGYCSEQPAKGSPVHPRFYLREHAEKKADSSRVLTMWDDLESMMAFAHYGVHADAMKENRRLGWLVDPRQLFPGYVVWWSDTESATYADGCRRLEHLHDNGPSPYAFNFKKPFTVDGEPYQLDQARLAGYKKWYSENKQPSIDAASVRPVTRVSDPGKSRRFYERALAPLGYEVLIEVPTEHTGGRVVLGFGVPPKPDFWMHEMQAGAPNVVPIQIAFRAQNRKQVDAFYADALAAGGRDNGAPGPRPHHHEHYYGGVVLDPDGHTVEVACHDPPAG
jgi:catechol 2,3-dioxygenase-like lactoylglutathione lyase family enzyme